MHNKIWRKALFLFPAALLLAALHPSVSAAQPARTESIAAIVNEDAVSESELMDRLRLVISSSGMPDNREMRERMAPQILNYLIEEKLKLQEAHKEKIAVLPEEIARGFAAIAGQNDFTPEQFREMLGRSGVSVRSLEDQIRAQLAWSKLVQTRLRPQVLVADNEVDAVIARMQASEGKAEYRAYEIFLPVENPSEEQDVKALAGRLTREIAERKAPFQRLAAQFSKAPGATSGGDMGWIQEGQLSEELDGTLSGLEKGATSAPVRTASGYHILLLRDKRVLTPENIPSRDQIMEKLGSEKLDRLQRSYLLDLKTDAFIERRV